METNIAYPASSRFLNEARRKLIKQAKDSGLDLRRLHAPHTYYNSKGKTHKSYEFGMKVSLFVTHKKGLALSSRVLDHAAYDGHTLKESLEKAEKRASKGLRGRLLAKATGDMELRIERSTAPDSAKV